MEIPGGWGVHQLPSGMEILGGWGGLNWRTIHGGGMDIFWNHTLQIHAALSVSFSQTEMLCYVMLCYCQTEKLMKVDCEKLTT